MATTISIPVMRSIEAYAVLVDEDNDLVVSEQVVCRVMFRGPAFWNFDRKIILTAKVSSRMRIGVLSTKGYPILQWRPEMLNWLNKGDSFQIEPAP